MEAGSLRETWQGRALAATYNTSIFGRIVLSVLAHSHDDIEVLMRAVLGHSQAHMPQLSTAAKVAKNGTIIASVIGADGRLRPNQTLFRNERAMEFKFRKLADHLKLTDADRIALFDTLKRWVVADHRLDPTMDPRDPEAKRLVLH